MDKPKPRIVIEPMLFGDMCIGVYDENNNLLLDKKYFIRGSVVTILCANKIKEDMYPDSKIYIWDLEKNKEVLLVGQGSNSEEKVNE